MQLNAGSSVLAGAFGTAPSPATWVINGSLDTATLETLVARGATQFHPAGRGAQSPAGHRPGEPRSPCRPPCSAPAPRRSPTGPTLA